MTLLSLMHILVGAHVEFPAEYEVVYAMALDRKGHLLDRWMAKQTRYKRARRQTQEDHIFINISGTVSHFQLKLSRNRDFLSPGFKIYRRWPPSVNRTHTEDIEKGTITETVDTDCYYSGKVLENNNTVAALTLCGGLRGIIQTPEEDYVIEPFPSSLAAKEQSSKERNGEGAGRRRQEEGDDGGGGRGGDSPRRPTRSNKRRRTDDISIPHIMYKASSLKRNRSPQYFEDDTYGHSEQESTVSSNGRTFSSRIPRSVQNPYYRHQPYYNTHYHRKRTLEILVVIDKEMYWKHGGENITTYVLSIFNIVSQLFLDDSIGYKIHIVLVGLILLEGDEPGLNIVHHADQTLNTFCLWQSMLLGGHSKRHDHAILMTGVDICSNRNAPCDTLGYAPIKGMCKETRSCTVNEDTGLPTAFTVAHEIGHNFGMIHDGDRNKCTTGTGTIMSPTITGRRGKFRWSECSRNYLTQFLRTPQSQCLDDFPPEGPRLKFPEKLPGQLYDSDTQCKWQFGKQAKRCHFDFGKDLCKSLWCYSGGQMCETKFFPAAEGTPCGSSIYTGTGNSATSSAETPRMWCYQGSCVPANPRHVEQYIRMYEQIHAIHGKWSEWGHWSTCTRECGGGIRQRSRHCSNYRYGAKVCNGETTSYLMCNTQRCPESQIDYRTEQCQAYNAKIFHGRFYKWKPYTRWTEASDQCKLYCQPDGYSFFYALAPMVKDGTRCNDMTTDVCIQGECLPIGCDYIVNSGAKKDICGVCKGDNSSCSIVSGDFFGQPKSHSYAEIAVFPKGARSLYIREKSPSFNYLALRNVQKTIYLNGKWHLSNAGTHVLGNQKFEYKRVQGHGRQQMETIMAEGPLKEDFILELLSMGPNPGVAFSYTVPKSVSTTQFPAAHYKWVRYVMQDCSKECGVQSEKVIETECRYEKNNVKVEPDLCDLTIKPPTQRYQCRAWACPARWVPGAWKVCSRSCGTGKKRRKIYCKQITEYGKDKKVKKKLCANVPKPARQKSCNTNPCPARWRSGHWSTCSVSCGKGTKVRKVSCSRRTAKKWENLPDKECGPNPKPISRRTCRPQSQCPEGRIHQWAASAWSACTASCGPGGIRKRTLKCTKLDKLSGALKVTLDSNCQHIAKPNIPLKKTCDNQIPCPPPETFYWHISSYWSECSQSCGDGGLQRRAVQCLSRTWKVVSNEFCSGNNKPIDVRRCPHQPCPATPSPPCVDTLKWCQLIFNNNMCSYGNYRTKCCYTCSRHKY